MTCQSASGCDGKKVCNADGRGFGACLCTDAGGSSGAAGSGGSSGGVGATGGIGGNDGTGGSTGGTAGSTGGTAGSTSGTAGSTGGTAGSTSGTGGTPGSAGGTGGLDAGRSYRDTVLADGPLGHWRLGEGIGAVSTVSEVNSLTGVPQGGVSFGVTGALSSTTNTAADFDGSDGCVSIGNVASLSFVASSSFTLEAWIKPDTSASGAREIVAKSGNDGPASGGIGYSLGLVNNQVRLRVINGTNGDNLSSAVAIPLAAFSHVVATVEGATNVARLYINGSQIATKTLLYEPGPTSSRFAIGCRMNGAGSVTDAIDGAIDEVVVYDKVLPAAAVREHFDAR